MLTLPAMYKSKVSCVRKSSSHLSKDGRGEVKPKICISLQRGIIQQVILWYVFLKLQVLRLYKVYLLDVELVDCVDEEGAQHGHDRPCSWARPGQVVWVAKRHGEELLGIYRHVEDCRGTQEVT